MPLPNLSQKWRLHVELKPLNLAVKLHSLGGVMKNFPCDILRNNVEIGWYRANAGPIQAGQCWADTSGPMLGRYRQVHRLLSWCVQCTGSVPLPVQTVLASITPALAQYLCVCWELGYRITSLYKYYNTNRYRYLQRPPLLAIVLANV